MPDTITHIHENKNPDSLETGTAGKGGVIKVYFDANNTEDAKAKIKKALELRDYANTEISKVEIRVQ